MPDDDMIAAEAALERDDAERVDEFEEAEEAYRRDEAERSD